MWLHQIFIIATIEPMQINTINSTVIDKQIANFQTHLVIYQLFREYCNISVIIYVHLSQRHCDCAGSRTRFLSDYSHRIFYSAVPGDNARGVLPMPPGGLIGIIHYAKSEFLFTAFCCIIINYD